MFTHSMNFSSLSFIFSPSSFALRHKLQKTSAALSLNLSHSLTDDRMYKSPLRRNKIEFQQKKTIFLLWRAPFQRQFICIWIGSDECTLSSHKKYFLELFHACDSFVAFCLQCALLWFKRDTHEHPVKMSVSLPN